MKSESASYASAGVDVTAGYRSVELMKDYIKSTKTPGVLGTIGGFGGLFEIPAGEYKNPVFISGTDGVGTKLKIAFLLGKHDTIGIDCVAMCTNDIICSGAKPLFFLDYIACGKNIPEKIAEIVKGVSEGCISSECALVGGETAEHPGLMKEEEYDLAGFCVGIVEKDKILKKENVKPGDALIGLESNGVHSNGFSLVRKIFKINDEFTDYYVTELSCTLLEEQLKPTKIYVKPVLKLMENFTLHGVSHITGGGFYENVPRMLNGSVTAVIEKNKLFKQGIFDLIEKEGDIPEKDMFNTYNMGVGMVISVDSTAADGAVRFLKENGQNAAVIGEVKPGDGGIEII